MTFGPVCEDINMTNLTDAEFQDLKQSATDMTSHHNVYIVFALSVVGFAGIPGNTIVLVAWLKSPALKCSVRYYVMAIAAYNLLACLVGIPADIAELYLLVRIIDPIILCKLGKFTLMVANVGCVYSLTFVALDRYLNIVHPAHCKISERQQLCLLALGFGLALTMSFPVLVVYGKHTLMAKSIPEQVCGAADQYKKTGWPTLLNLAMLLTIFLAYIAVTSMYCAIIRKLWCYTSPPANVVESEAAYSSRGVSPGQKQVVVQPCPDVTIADRDAMDLQDIVVEDGHGVNVSQSCSAGRESAGNKSNNFDDSESSESGNVLPTHYKRVPGLLIPAIHVTPSTPTHSRERLGVATRRKISAAATYVRRKSVGILPKLSRGSETVEMDVLNVPAKQSRSRRKMSLVRMDPSCPPSSRPSRQSPEEAQRRQSPGVAQRRQSLGVVERKQSSGRPTSSQASILSVGLLRIVRLGSRAVKTNEPSSQASRQNVEGIQRRPSSERPVEGAAPSSRPSRESVGRALSKLSLKRNVQDDAPLSSRPTRQSVGGVASKSSSRPAVQDDEPSSQPTPRLSPPGLKKHMTSRQKTEMVTATMIAVTFAFFLSYTPYVVFIILVVMDDTYLATARCDEVGYLSSHLFQRSYYLIISLNPLVYSAANPVFRRECCRLSGYCPFGKELSDRQSDGSKRPILTSDHIK